jgi:hypothetical protein
VLSAIAIVPSALVLVPELAGTAAAELADLREAVFAAAASLPRRWIAVGVGPSEVVIGPAQSGTFAGFGVDVQVEFSAGSTGQAADLPVCALIAGWLRGQVQPEAHTEVRTYAHTLDAEGALSRGRQLRADIDAATESVGVLVVADGAITLTPPAPGGYDPASLDIQLTLDRALAGGDAAALARLPGSIVGRVAYQVMAGLSGGAPRTAKELYRGAPYGVGYFAGVWQP